MSGPSLAERAFRAAMVVLPHELRTAHGDDMLAVLRIRLTETRGSLARIRLWVGAFADLLGVAVSERWRGTSVRRPSRLRHATRALVRRPAFALSSVFTMGLALAMLTSVWTVLDTTILRPLPYPNDERLANAVGVAVNREALEAWERSSPAVEAVAPWTLDGGVLRGPAEALNVRSMVVGERFLDLVGARVVMGRALVPADYAGDAAPVAVVARSLWNRRFGSGVSLSGQAIDVSGEVLTVVGVVDDFQLMSYREIVLWRPLRSSTERTSGLVLLARGWTVEDAARGLAATALPMLDPDIAASIEADPRREPLYLRSMRASMRDGLRGVLWILALAASLVVVIACANVSSLFMARAEERQEEFAVRRSLGATRSELIREVLTETSVVAALGGGLGVLASPWLLGLLLSVAPTVLPGINEVALDGRVVAVVSLVALIAVLLVGGVPALVASRSAGLRLGRSPGPAAGRGTVRFLSTLVYIEVTMSMILVVGVGSLVRTMVDLYPHDPGFSTQGRMAAHFDLPADSHADPQARLAFAEGLRRASRGMPGAPRSAVSTLLPFGDLWWAIPVSAVDGVEPDALEEIHFRAVSPDYFDVLEIPVLAGRPILEADAPGSTPAAVVNRTAARALWGGDVDPVGHTISFAATYGGPPIRWRVVGVVGDIRTVGTLNRYLPEVWVPYAQAPLERLSWVVDASNTRLGKQELQAAAAALDRAVPVDGVTTLDEMISATMTWPRFQLSLLGALGGSGLLLAGLGCFAVLSYRYRRARREISVRMALGARPGGVFGEYLAKALALGAAGCASGILVSWMLAAWVETRLYLRDVGARDPLTYAGGTLVLLVVLTIATLLPGRRAATVDPAAALRD